MNAQMGISNDIVLEALAVALSVACMLYCRRFRSIARWIAAYAAFLAIGYGLASLNNNFAAPFASMFLVYRHVFPLFMFASNMIATTRAGELACALQTLHVPSRVTVAFCVALRFLPTMAREFGAVRDAMRTRGISLAPSSIALHPVRTIERFLVPVMARLGTIADELGNAVIVRGVETDRARSSYYELRLNAMDMLASACAACLLTLAVLLRAGAIAW